MPILRVQHAVAAFDGWKRAFDNDPVGRKEGGVRRYQVLRCLAEPNLVMIDLEFETLSQAEAFADRLRALWSGAAKAVTRDPQAWIVERIESAEL